MNQSIATSEEKNDVTRPRATTQDWRAFVRARGLKLTGQRQAVLDAFVETDGHVTLEEILAEARKKHPHLGLATVYRTMKLLEEAGFAERHGFEGGLARYERTEGRKHHDHMICRGCGLIHEFESEEIEALQSAVARSFEFVVAGHRHEIYGFCKTCARTKVKAVKESR
jgi:Fur family ferric uptake transcriptional regulator